jgi:hypothetical protein
MEEASWVPETELDTTDCIPHSQQYCTDSPGERGMGRVLGEQGTSSRRDVIKWCHSWRTRVYKTHPSDIFITTRSILE